MRPIIVPKSPRSVQLFAKKLKRPIRLFKVGKASNISFSIARSISASRRLVLIIPDRMMLTNGCFDPTLHASIACRYWRDSTCPMMVAMKPLAFNRWRTNITNPRSKKMPIPMIETIKMTYIIQPPLSRYSSMVANPPLSSFFAAFSAAGAELARQRCGCLLYWFRSCCRSGFRRWRPLHGLRRGFDTLRRCGRWLLPLRCFPVSLGQHEARRKQ